jgi:pimeloyl-ACP methyl ester carboxylesterase
MSTFLRLLAAVVLLAAAAVAAVLFRVTRRAKGSSFDSNGVRIHYTFDGEGEPVVLLHGFAVNADINWRLPGITRALARDFNVIAMDLRGHGLSGKPDEARKHGMEMVDDVLRLLDHLRIEKAHVVGYSLGGVIALKLAATHPERLLTASSLGVGWERPDNSAFLAALPDIEADLKSGRGIGPLSSYLGDEREKPGLLHTMWVKLMTRYLNDGASLAAMVRAIPDLTIEEEELRRISVPMCSIVGSRDPLRVGVEAMEGLVPDLSVVVLDGADHISAPRNPRLVAALRVFLRRHSDKATVS